MRSRSFLLIISLLSSCLVLVAGCVPESPTISQPTSTPVLDATSTAVPTFMPVAANSVAIKDGEEINLVLDTGASVLIHEGSISAGNAVELRTADPTEWSKPDSGVAIVGQVYTIVSEKVDSGITATITLPFPDDVLSDTEIDQLSIAYLDASRWYSLPSTVNREDATVSAVLHHFSNYAIIRRITFNSRPKVTVSVSPTIYSGVDINDSANLNLEDLSVRIEASDPDGDPVSVYLTLGFETDASLGAGKMSELGSQLVSLMVIEASAISIIDGNTAAVEVATQVRDQIAFPVEAGILTTDTVELVPTVSAGVFEISIPLSGLGLDLESPLRNIYLFITVTDDLEEDPKRVEKRIPVTGMKLPTPMALIAPGPSSTVRCPALPEFRWDWPSAQDSMEHYRFRLVRGDDLWGARFPTADWACNKWNGCESGGPDGYVANSWTPTEPLTDGAVYSWGMLTGSGKDPLRFEDDTAVQSETFRFIVDASISGNKCLGSEEFTDLSVFLPAFEEALQNADFEQLPLFTADPFYASWNSIENPEPFVPPAEARDLILNEMENTWGIVPGSFTIRSMNEGNRLAADLGLTPTNGFGFLAATYETGDPDEELWTVLLGLGHIDGRYYWTEFIGLRPSASEPSCEDFFGEDYLLWMMGDYWRCGFAFDCSMNDMSQEEVEQICISAAPHLILDAAFFFTNEECHCAFIAPLGEYDKYNEPRP